MEIKVKCQVHYISKEIYITSDEEIKEGDWVLNTSSNEIYQCNDASKSNQYKHNKKIIATTDKSLNIDISSEFQKKHYIKEFKYLPQLSQEFIEKYIKEYNKGNIITDILVEYAQDLNSVKKISNDLQTWNYKLKISKDNTITIHPIKESYNREEVIELLYKSRFHKDSSDEKFDNWIKDNL